MSVSSPGTPMRPACSGASFANTPIRTWEFALLRWIHSGCLGLAAAPGWAAAGFAGAAALGAGDFGAAALACARPVPGTAKSATRAAATTAARALRVVRGERGTFTGFLLDWGEGSACMIRHAARCGDPESSGAGGAT